MNFVVGAKEDLDAWADLGNPGWDWASFSKYLKKTYTVTAGSKVDNDGAIQTNIPDEETKWPGVWRDTLASLGYPADNDPFSGEIHGAVMYPDAIHPLTKTRSYAGNAYLAPARGRANLTVWTGVQVEKILFDKTAEKAIATGVQYTKDGTSGIVTARKEVILCAGVFHSPKILELSGIGDARLLESLDIDVVVDNPHVGENLQHHPLSILSFEAIDDGKPGFDTLDALARQDPAAISAAMEAYTTAKRGPFSQTNFNTMAHIPFPGPQHEATDLLTNPTPTPPQTQTAAYTTAATTLTHTSLTSPTTASGYYVFIPTRANPGPSGRNTPAPSSSTTNPSERYISIALLLTRPLSRGSAHITSAQPAQKPAIDPRLLSHPLDVEVLARHVRFLESTLVKAQPLAGRLKEGGKRTPEGWGPGFTGGDLERVRAFLGETAVASTLYTSTCSMMPREMGGVVDSGLRVYGTGNLRVVDASVMPFITRGDTMATVYGIAEKAADVIKGGL
jgi:choline dehydrogenase-like flavoprotein